VIVEQLTSGPWNNFLFITYLGMVVEGIVSLGVVCLVVQYIYRGA
jgi:hypothetical protein